MLTTEVLMYKILFTEHTVIVTHSSNAQIGYAVHDFEEDNKSRTTNSETKSKK